MGHKAAVLYGSRAGGIIFEQLEWAKDIELKNCTILSYDEVVSWIAGNVGYKQIINE